MGVVVCEFCVLSAQLPIPHSPVPPNRPPYMRLLPTRHCPLNLVNNRVRGGSSGADAYGFTGGECSRNTGGAFGKNAGFFALQGNGKQPSGVGRFFAPGNDHRVNLQQKTAQAFLPLGGG